MFRGRGNSLLCTLPFQWTKNQTISWLEVWSMFIQGEKVFLKLSSITKTDQANFTIFTWKFDQTLRKCQFLALWCGQKFYLKLLDFMGIIFNYFLFFRNQSCWLHVTRWWQSIRRHQISNQKTSNHKSQRTNDS